jgi:soluble lytic murein transglycosylase-like protein
MQGLIFIIGGLLIIYYYSNLQNNQIIDNINSDSDNYFDSNFINIDYNLIDSIFNKFSSMVQLIIIQYNLEISSNMILAVIYQESGYNAIKKTCGEVVGDNGKSFGYMQVQKGALDDVISYYGIPFSLSNLQNDAMTNITVGALYLNLGFKQAFVSPNQIQLAFKKYNGGLGQTDNSISSASNYAAKVYQIFIAEGA